MNNNEGGLTDGLVRRLFGSKAVEDPLSGQRMFVSRLKKLIALGSLAALGYLTYIHVFGSKVEVVCMETEANLTLTRKITELRTQKYHRSALLPFRFMEIVYGNMYDKREYCEYQREVLIQEDGENIALGALTRLGRTAPGDRPEPGLPRAAAGGSGDPRVDRRRGLYLHQVS